MKTDKEVWVDVRDYEGQYQISNFGRVKSLRRKVKNTKYSFREIPEKILKYFISGSGYPTVSLLSSQKKKNFSIHRLVAEAFIPNPEDKPCVNHKNSIRDDNSVSNLEWCTHSENILHGYKDGNMVAPRSQLGKSGRLHHASKVVYKYDLEYNFLSEYESANIAAKINNTTSGSISSVCNGKFKSLHGYIYSYKKYH